MGLTKKYNKMQRRMKIKKWKMKRKKKIIEIMEIGVKAKKRNYPRHFLVATRFKIESKKWKQTTPKASFERSVDPWVCEKNPRDGALFCIASIKLPKFILKKCLRFMLLLRLGGFAIVKTLTHKTCSPKLKKENPHIQRKRRKSNTTRPKTNKQTRYKHDKKTTYAQS